jgi:hypothetical protein
MWLLEQPSQKTEKLHRLSLVTALPFDRPLGILWGVYNFGDLVDAKAFLGSSLCLGNTQSSLYTWLAVTNEFHIGLLIA